MAGSLGRAHGAIILRTLRRAAEARIPVVGFISSAGARIQEGSGALDAYARIFRESVRLAEVVPQISVICGVAAGGGSYSPALTDYVLMTQRAAMFLTGPSIVSQAIGESIDVTGLGGPRIHEKNGVCDLVTADDLTAVDLVRDLLAYLPQGIGDPIHEGTTVPPDLADPGSILPESGRFVYDMRSVIAGIVDSASLIELGARRGKNLITALARIEGQAVGIVANQPRHMGGVLDSVASEKGAGFVAQCDRFGLPVVVLVDTPGFMPGLAHERAGIIRFGAMLVRAFAQAQVERFTVVVRKAYGGAYIAMNSKGLGASEVFAWPGAEIGIMGAESAVRLTRRREIEAAPDDALVDRLVSDYEARLTATVALEQGIVDEIVEPGHTRHRLAEALRRTRPGPIVDG